MITAKFNFSLIFSMILFLHMLCLSCDKDMNIQEPQNETALYVLPPDDPLIRGTAYTAEPY